MLASECSKSELVGGFAKGHSDTMVCVVTIDTRDDEGLDELV